ncbi:MAG: hypothetical protein IPG92_02495 [Flavobacteriales bacterium]|nr:hypothetical protein [Flavobacteriales bacterium]
MPTAFSGRLITPANYNEKYIYEVSHDGGAIRTGNSPRIQDNFTKFILDYVTDPKSISSATDLWDLSLIYQNSPPRTITVEVWLDGAMKKGDKPRMQDGK